MINTTMKFSEIQGYARQPSIIHTRLFVWQDSFPQLLESAGEAMDGHIRGFKLEDGELIATNNWEDKVSGKILTKLGPEHIQEAAEHYDGELIIVPAFCRMVRVEAQMFV